jgi:MerR family transcriptional regulator/heat shock protein HspR
LEVENVVLLNETKIDQNKGVYVMYVAADLAGMHPQTLRKYERCGFVKPVRHNTLRLYSVNDIERLMYIKRLARKGLNVQGIRFILDVKDTLEGFDEVSALNRLREMVKVQGWTIQTGSVEQTWTGGIIQDKRG